LFPFVFVGWDSFLLVAAAAVAVAVAVAATVSLVLSWSPVAHALVFTLAGLQHKPLSCRQEKYRSPLTEPEFLP